MHCFFNSLHLSWLWTLYFRLLNQRDHVHYTKGFAQPGFDWAHGISLYPFLLSKNFYPVFKNIFKEIVEHVYWFAFFMDLDQHLVFHDVWAAQEGVLIAQSSNCDTHPHAKLSSAPGFNQNLIVCCFSQLSHWLPFIAHQEAREEIPNPDDSSNSRARPDPVKAKDPNEAGLQHLRKIHVLWSSSLFSDIF